MLTVSLDCLSSSCVLTRHKTKTNNPEKLSTLDTQDEDKQSRETVNIRYTRQFLWIVCLRLVYLMLTVSLDCLSSSCVSNVDSFSGLFVNCQHWIHKTKTNNPEKLSTLDTQDTRRRQTIQRNCQHWIHKTKTNNPEKLSI
jgi:hypothetical protein